MPNPQPTYNEQIRKARQQILDRVRYGDLDRVRAAIAETLAQVRQQAPDGPLTPETAEQLRRQYESALQTLRSDLVAATEAERSQAVQETASAHEEALAAAAVTAGLFASAEAARREMPPIAEWAPRYRERISLHLQVRRGLDEDMTPEGYITRILSSVGSEIDDAISNVLDENSSAEEAAKKSVTEVVQNISAAIADDDLNDALGSVGLGALVDEGSSFDLEGARQLGSSLRRVISHEVAHIADETGKTLSALNPAVDLVQWKLSASHTPEKSYVPDVCDVLATADLYGYGEGVYPPATVPSLPHPHCECSQSTILKSPSEWFSGESREVPDEPDLKYGPVRSMMEEADGDRTLTQSYIEDTQDEMRRVLGAVHENPRGHSL